MIITKKYILSTLFLSVLLNYQGLMGDNTIVMQLRNAPEEMRLEVEKLFEKQRDTKKFTSSLKQKTPSDFNKTLVKSSIRSILKPTLSGFVCIYGGYTDTSDPDGMITFPLRHPGENVLVVVTPSINLVHFEDNTILYSTFNRKAKCYLFTKKTFQETVPTNSAAAPATTAEPTAAQTEPAPTRKERTYWQVVEKPVKVGERIDPTSIIILTNTNNIAILPGNYLASKSVQCVLPNAFYVIGNEHNNEDTLNILNIKGFFERIATEKKVAKDNVEQRRMTNL